MLNVGLTNGFALYQPMQTMRKEKTMNITVNWERYAKKVLKNLEKDLKKTKSDWEKEDLEKEIATHKYRYAEYLK